VAATGPAYEAIQNVGEAEFYRAAVEQAAGRLRDGLPLRALADQEKVMAAWARKVARDPNATTPRDIQALRDSGLDDGQIFAITAFVALRLAFSTINDSLGAQPDAQLARSLPREVREAVTYGRPVATEAYLQPESATALWP
jgi:alkylhydroperoxidase family enzyme